MHQKPLHQTTFEDKTISEFTDFFNSKHLTTAKKPGHQAPFTTDYFFTKQGLYQTYFTLFFSPKQVLYQICFTPNSFYSGNFLRQKTLNPNTFTPNSFCTRNLLRQTPFYTKLFLRQQPFTAIDVVSTDCMMPAANSHAVCGQQMSKFAKRKATHFAWCPLIFFSPSFRHSQLV